MINLTDTSCMCNDLFFYRSEQPKTIDESVTKSEKEKLSVESPLESVAEAMLEPGYVLSDTLRSWQFTRIKRFRLMVVLFRILLGN